MLALWTASMKWSLAYADFKAATKGVQEISTKLEELKIEQERLIRSRNTLEMEMERCNAVLKLCAVKDRAEKIWEEENASGNLAALEKLRRRMSVEEQNLSQDNILRLILLNVKDIVEMQLNTLEKMSTTGLTLTERRAIYEVLRPAGREWEAMSLDRVAERKWAWYCKMKEDFKEYLSAWKLHVDQYGPPGAHPYATKENPEGCPLIGNQCPLKADTLVNCAEDCKFTLFDDDRVAQAAMADAEKTDSHYKGNPTRVFRVPSIDEVPREEDEDPEAIFRASGMFYYSPGDTGQVLRLCRSFYEAELLRKYPRSWYEMPVEPID